MSKNEMIMLPREVVERALDALEHAEKDSADFQRINTDQTGDAIAALRTALEQPQSNPVPYLLYDPNNGDTWTQEAINDGCCLPDGLIALYTK